MRVIAANRPASQAEKDFASALESIRVPGFAVTGVYTPAIDAWRGCRQLDALVFQPHGLTLVEVKNPVSQPGVLQPVLNGPWTVDGAPVRWQRADKTRSGHGKRPAISNPFEQLKTARQATVDGLARSGLVCPEIRQLIVVATVTSITPEHGMAGDRTWRICTLDAAEIRKALHELTLAQARPAHRQWTVQDVLHCMHALDISLPEATPQTIEKWGLPQAPAANFDAATTHPPSNTGTPTPKREPAAQPREQARQADIDRVEIDQLEEKYRAPSATPARPSEGSASPTRPAPPSQASTPGPTQPPRQTPPQAPFQPPRPNYSTPPRPTGPTPQFPLRTFSPSRQPPYPMSPQPIDYRNVPRPPSLLPRGLTRWMRRHKLLCAIAILALISGLASIPLHKVSTPTTAAPPAAPLFTLPSGIRLQAATTITKCAPHAYGEVARYFSHTAECASARRGLASAQAGARPVVVVLEAVTMRSATAAANLKRLLDKDGTGDLNDLLREHVTYHGAPRTVPVTAYTSSLKGSTLFVTEAGYADGGRSTATDPTLKRIATQSNQSIARH